MFKSQIKFLVIRALEKESLSGYGLMKLLKQQTGKKPSPGYMYPLLHDLEKDGFVSVQEGKRNKLYSITAKGKTFLAELLKKHRKSIDAVVKAFEPLNEKQESEQFYLMHTRMLTFKEQMMQDMDVFSNFRCALFDIYEENDPAKRRKLRRIIREATQKLEKISR
ncbi:MAG TPA: PadR family transcriptional regulator [Calditrichia bacterium]|nr:PadR family transcriptional regulator [Calditrichota bacterium]HQU74289.1 PadR family transcriptional regulator [Calditrichia bacterium]HQV31023.1 PadR family transcriptional regulator [Calditrichia bacterium]